VERFSVCHTWQVLAASSGAFHTAMNAR
jgi:hypothetical protein